MIAAWLAFFDGLVAIAMAMAGIVGAHFDLIAPVFGFQLVVAGLVFAAIALVFAMLALIMMSFSPVRRIMMPRAISGGVMALFLLVPALLIFFTHPTKPLDDATTDIEHPPEFVHDAQSRDMKYDAARYAPIQRSVAPYNTLASLPIDRPPDTIFRKAEIIAGEIHFWEISYTDPQTRTIEGVATSWLFHFKDDFVIQIRPAPGGGSLVEMRSKSRPGEPDLGGANYNRIESFFRLVQGPPRGGVSAN